MSNFISIIKTPPRNIFLVGPMGAGKTTIGRQLARALNVEFVDSDQEIEIQTGADITWIFDIEGESGFRLRETEAIDALTQRSGIVLATGGGAVLAPQNRTFLKNRGTVIYFYADLELLFKRTEKDSNRPLLHTEDPKARLEKLIKERDPLYREVADIVIDTGDNSVRNTINLILESL